ncbi:MAG: NAD(P)-dependent alcohol dehydrogenase [Candidatus Promineifilaceae bacterium]|nr:NAD(P)-dependent alcohol dehydrogenase [Candidatus Promineifilaceae bacterium]
MKAVIYEQYGPPEVLQVTELSKPAPKDNEILVKVKATSVTAGDTRMRSFTVPLSFWLPARIALGIRKPKNPIIGMECAGVVEAVGQQVTRFKVGDAVFASTLESGFGGYAEYICLPEDGVVALMPSNISFPEAAAVPVGARTALYFLREANIQRGQKVLIYGASGSVGSYAVQLAAYFGAEVTAVCSTANLDWVASLGAAQTIDYTRDDFSRSGEKYDVIFDTVGKADYAACINSLKPLGSYLNAVSSPGVALRMRWTAVTSGKKMVGGGPPRSSEDMTVLAELIEAGEVRVVIDRCYPLEKIVAAHRYVDLGHKKGNVPIVLDST